MTKQQVFVTGAFPEDGQAYRDLTAKYDVIRYKFTSREQLLQAFKTTLKNISGMYAHFGSLYAIGGFNRELLENAPPNLKIIAIPQIGYDEYDLEGMAKKGIMLTNLPTPLAAEAVADLVLYHAILSFRNFKIFDKYTNTKGLTTGQVRAELNTGSFDLESGLLVPSKLAPAARKNYDVSVIISGRSNTLPRGHHAVIVGFGSIGKVAGQRLSAIGMNIHYVKNTKLDPEVEASLGYKVTYHQSIKDTVDFADLIIIACPGNAQTKHMINDELITSMKKQIRIVNVGRGFVVDENALVRGLQSGKVIFAGLDVYEEEPRIHPGLIGREDVVLTPHCASSTVDLLDYALDVCFNNINEVLTESNGYINKVV
ncbi:hydroxyisocaproate dehydrogenase [Suhomyces tanzawaensis NRRL Y-17324]|uniref:Hydroxyisocaproate dehydrogenase n=1 Tax=Suhomyces tanzawaensis NRRL Y-17324 TaxID=984487 RepID=A0A1E4SCP9_9ASCO|nr:hydroxyisocaproate dehydrogenase [Suhomyces tanzawaensis NRRL Y-17324]ODV77279.1 hydroxyisocaproate dehydrogenase [Suhomyces tanzawaensis NRRL Y-17324]